MPALFFRFLFYADNAMGLERKAPLRMCENCIYAGLQIISPLLLIVDIAWLQETVSGMDVVILL